MAAAEEGRLAVDMEADGFWAYRARPCLWQFAAGRVAWLLDPLQGDAAEGLAAVFGDSRFVKVFHGADYDLRMIQEAHGLRPAPFEDTQIAAQLLGVGAIGLESLLESRLGVKVVKSKKLQRANWARRPLPDDLLRYAVGDVADLLALRDDLAKELEAKRRLGWWAEECDSLQPIPATEGQEGPRMAHRIKGAKDLDRRQLAVLEALWASRERWGREENRATFRLVGTEALLSIARAQKGGRPRGLGALPKRIPPARRAQFEEAVGRALALPRDRLPRFDPPRRRRAPKGPPKAMEALRSARGKAAKRLGIDPGVLISGRILAAIAKGRPRTVEELSAVEGVRAWQVEEFGAGLVAALKGRAS